MPPPPAGKGEAEAGGSGSADDGAGPSNAQGGSGSQAVGVFNSDPYTVGFMLLMLVMGLMKAAQNRCTC